MRINLLYNKIVADTITEGFIESFNKTAFPKLSEMFPDVEEAVIYEDYLSCGFNVGGGFYCPVTLICGGSLSYAFLSWRFDSKKFKDAVPYAYIGKDVLNIEVSDTAPAAVEEKIKGRVPFFAKNGIKLTLSATAPDKTFLSGRYSQSFIDVMREKIACALEEEFNVEGVKDSTLEITLAFEPETYMEHVLDNETYRRVLISAKACAPRDLWVKWTRLDGNGTYTVSSHVNESDITFEICSDVPEKIREREYRFLMKTSGMPAYKNAMSRKNFTEWRELVKRVIKRGELTELPKEDSDITPAKPFIPEKMLELPTEPLREYEIENEPVTTEEAQDAFDSEISLKLQSVLENYNIETEEDEEEDTEDINPDITELLRALLSGNGEETEEETENLSDEGEDDELPPFDIEEELEEIELENTETDGNDEIYSDEAEEIEDFEEHEEASVYATESEPLTFSSENDEDVNGILEDKENEILALKERNNELADKLSALEAENAKLSALVLECEKALEASRLERSVLIENLDAAKRREEREKDRLAEAAKIAVAERAMEEKNAAAEEDEEEKAKLREEAERLEREAARKREAEALAEQKQQEEKASGDEKAAPVRYVSKVADISFRHPVDPNITKRIQEIIVTTVKYFGKENVYMKIKASIPDHYMVRLEFLKIPENESTLLSDIIRVLGHSKLGITKVLLD